MVYIYAYTGARFSQGLCGSSEIDLTKVPISPPGTPAVVCTFVLAFAIDDGAGNFQPTWDTDHFSAQNLAGVRAANPGVNFALSLGGGSSNGSWPSPGDSQTWISNAVSSITGIMQSYGLVGVDVDYEIGLDETFVPVMSSLIPQISPAFWSLAPDNQHLETYLDLYDAVAGMGVKPTINFQAYSMETENEQEYIDKYTYIKNDPRVASHGGANIGFGIDTNTTSPRGMQYPAVTDLCFSQFEEGSTVPQGLWDVAMVWSLEDSCLNGFPVERTLSGPPPS